MRNHLEKACAEGHVTHLLFGHPITSLERLKQILTQTRIQDLLVRDALGSELQACCRRRREQHLGGPRAGPDL